MVAPLFVATAFRCALLRSRSLAILANYTMDMLAIAAEQGRLQGNLMLSNAEEHIQHESFDEALSMHLHVGLIMYSVAAP